MIKIFNEDCLEGMEKIESGTVDLIVTDPPYCVGMTSNGIKGTFNDFNLIKPFFKELFNQWQRILKDGAYLYICTDWRTYPFLYPLVEVFFKTRNLIIWDKDWINAGNWYRFRYELIIFATNGTGKRNFSNTTADIWKLRKLSPSGDRKHPQEKPVALFEQMILDGSKEGETVLDPFCGSGTAGVACINTGRKFIGYELDEKYFKVADERIKAALAEKRQELF